VLADYDELRGMLVELSRGRQRRDPLRIDVVESGLTTLPDGFGVGPIPPPPDVRAILCRMWGEPPQLAIDGRPADSGHDQAPIAGNIDSEQSRRAAP
jgi:hypothetical protein